MKGGLTSYLALEFNNNASCLVNTTKHRLATSGNLLQLMSLS